MIAAAAATAPLLSCRRLGLAHGGRVLLRDLDLELHAGELLAVTGPSGCGKSSLLRVLAGIDPPQCGTVTTAGARRGAIAVACQDAGLPAAISGLDAVLAGRLHALPWWRTLWRMPELHAGDARQRAAELGVDHLLERSVATTSGGERQRLAIARALHHGGRAILLDEPVSQLDPDAARLVMSRLRAVADAGTRGLLCIVHQPEQVAAFADRQLAFTGDGTWSLQAVRR